MPDAWKAAERAAAEIAGGVRAWSSEEDVDILVPDAKNPTHAIEVKWRKAITLAQIEGWLEHNQAKCDIFDPPLRNGLLVKRKAGRGKTTPWIAIFLITPDVDKNVHDGGVHTNG